MKPPKQSYDFRIETPNYFTAFPHDRIRVGGSENRTGYTISRFACTLNASGVASSAARIFDATPPAAQLKAGAIKNCPVQNCWLCRAANRKTESCHLRPARAFSATGPAAEDELCCNMRLFRATRATAFNGEARSPLTFHLKKAEVSSHTIDFTPFASLRQSAADQRKKLFIRSKIFWFFTDSARWKSGNSASFSTKRFSSALSFEGMVISTTTSSSPRP